MTHLAILGVHGAFGTELLAQCLARNAGDRVFVFDELGDPALESDVRARLRSKGLDETVGFDWLRLRPGEDRFGLNAAEIEHLFAEPLSVFVVPHVAPPGLSIEEQRCLATYGLGLLATLVSGRVARVHYVSSHLVAGDRMGAFTEYDFDCGQKPRNRHEFAAIEGESTARALFAKSSLNVYRLPFVAGVSSDGGMFDADDPYGRIVQVLTAKERVYADPSAAIPVAAIDHLAKQMLALASADDTRGTYHLAGCGNDAAALRSALGVGEAKYRGLPAYRLSAMFGNNGQASATHNPATAELSVAHYLYPQVHHDTYRYNVAAARLGLPHASACPLPRLPSTRDDAVHARYLTALRAYITTCTLGVLEHDTEWVRHAVIDDIALPYLDAGQGPPILFLAGALGTEYWLGALRYLAARHRCILIGSIGWSAGVPNQGVYAGHEEQAALIKGLLSQLGVRGAVHFVCTDVSAATLQYFASRWPEMIASLQWVNPITSPHEMARCLPVSARTAVLDEARRGKLLAALTKSESELRAVSGFDTLIRDKARRAPERWRRLRSQIAADPARLGLFCSALRERLTEHALPGIETLKSPSRVLWSCDNTVGDLSLYAKTLVDHATPADVVLIADAGLDLAEALPTRVGDLLARYIAMIEEAGSIPAATEQNGSDRASSNKRSDRNPAAASRSRIMEHA